jgi:hypothetical protein
MTLIQMPSKKTTDKSTDKVTDKKKASKKSSKVEKHESEDENEVQEVQEVQQVAVNHDSDRDDESEVSNEPVRDALDDKWRVDSDPEFDNDDHVTTTLHADEDILDYKKGSRRIMTGRNNGNNNGSSNNGNNNYSNGNGNGNHNNANYTNSNNGSGNNNNNGNNGKGTGYNGFAASKAMNFRYGDYRNFSGNVEDMSSVELMRVALVRAHDDSQYALMNALKDTLRACNLEQDFPTTKPQNNQQLDRPNNGRPMKNMDAKFPRKPQHDYKSR